MVGTISARGEGVRVNDGQGRPQSAKKEWWHPRRVQTSTEQSKLNNGLNNIKD